MLQKKDQSVTGLTRGIEFLFKKNKVDYFKGHGRFTSPHDIAVDGLDGTQHSLRAKNIIIATGSEPSPFSGIDVDEKQIVTSTGALSLEKVPESMVVIGGGVIGLELGSVWSRLGAKVTVVEYLDSIGAGMDSEMAKAFQKILKKQGIEFKLGTKVINTEKSDGKVVVNVEGVSSGASEKVAYELNS